jgi:hypothetical protein
MKYHGDGPFQTQISPSNSRFTEARIWAAMAEFRVRFPAEDAADGARADVTPYASDSAALTNASRTAVQPPPWPIVSWMI